MARIHTGRHGRLGALVLGLALVVAPGCATPQPAPPPKPSTSPPPSPPPSPSLSPLSANDVSWLFPPPKTAADLAKLIAVKDLIVPDPANPANRVPVWSDADFKNFLKIADSDNAQVAGGPRIGLPAGARIKDAWFVAGVRIDAGAPGLDPAIIAAFGQRPQIRLILQPVLSPGGVPQVQDVTAHLIFDFDTPSPTPACPLHATPDLAALKGIVGDAAALRTALATGQFGGTKISTVGLPLGVHPGLANAATAPATTAQMKAILQKRLSPVRLNSMAVMGLPANSPAPWIFVSMARQRPTDPFDAVRGPTLDGTQFAMMLTPIGQSPRVAPTPHTNNLAPAITCMSGALGPAALPLAMRQGNSTSDIFSAAAPDQAKVKAVVDLIADPKRSHFFNTDCVSCHTETTMAMGAPIKMTSSPGLSSDVMPNGPWDVRNFGWSIDRFLRASATRRTAAETAAVVAWLNANMLK